MAKSVLLTWAGTRGQWHSLNHQVGAVKEIYVSCRCQTLAGRLIWRASSPPGCRCQNVQIGVNNSHRQTHVNCGVERIEMRNSERHPGISMHRITVGGGVMGALFAVGTALIFLLGLPASRWFLLASLFVGVCVAALLYVWHRRHPVELGTDQPPTTPTPNRTIVRKRQLQYFNLLLTIMNQVALEKRAEFVAGLVKVLLKALPINRHQNQIPFPSWNHQTSSLSLLAEFCIRNGYAQTLLDGTLQLKMPSAGVAIMLTEVEEIIALRFRALQHLVFDFHDSTFECICKEFDVRTENGAILDAVPAMAALLFERRTK